MSDSADQSPWGWASTLEEFIETDELHILESLKEHHRERFPIFDLGTGQISAWIRTIDTFQDELEPLLQVSGAEDTLIVFEYELPGEGGRRPDVTLVTPSQEVIVIECKNRATWQSADIDQALQYERDLASFHSETPESQTDAFVALLEADGTVNDPHNRPITVIPDYDALRSALEESLQKPATYSPSHWLEGEYKPVPKLTDAVVDTFVDGELPDIKEVHRSSNVTEAKEHILEIAALADAENKHIMVLVTGAPGSGKTMVGLQSSILLQQDGYESMYLSGNGPLVAVIQDALRRAGAEPRAAKSIIRPLKDFKSGVSGNPSSSPAQVYIFDEGQRAWTSEQDNRYEGNEIELLVDVAERRDAGVLVGLIGEGQAIHKGEEGDLAAWVKSLERASGQDTEWEIVLPDSDVPRTEMVQSVRKEETLNLETNIRARYADELHNWVDAVLVGDETTAAEIATRLDEEGYTLLVTESRAAAEEFVTTKFPQPEPGEYGWLISSKHRDRGDSEGMSPEFIQDDAVYGAWFNAPPDNPQSSCQLTRPLSEFGCQGLEINFSLVFWGNDLTWNGSEWNIGSGIRDYEESPQTPTELTKNVYRVLLTRGRRGMLIRCRDEDTREFLSECGATVLD